MGARARVALLAALALASCRRQELPAVAAPAWSKALPGDTAVVLWRNDGASVRAQEPMLRWLETGAGMKRVEAGGVLAFAPRQGQATGWKSLAESPDFVEACGKVAAAAGGLYVSGLWVEPWFEKVSAGLPAVVAKRLSAFLQLSSLRYLWLAHEVSGDRFHAKGALEVTEMDSGLLGLLGSLPESSASAFAAERERSLRMRIAFDGAAVRRALSSLVEGEDASSSALSRVLPGAIVEPLLAAIPRTSAWVVVEMDSLQDAIACLSGVDVAAVARVLTIVGTKRGGEWALPGGFAASLGASSLFLRGAQSPEGAGLSSRATGCADCDGQLGFRCSLRSEAGGSARSLLVEKRPGRGTALPVEIRF